jgi:dihydroorotase
MTVRLTIPAISDMHVHLRQDELLKDVAPFTDRCCAYAVVMPNLMPPITTVERLMDYRKSLERELQHTQPLMTFKLIGTSTAESVRAFHEAGTVAGKLYPEGVTTNSADGIGREALEHPERFPRFQDALGEMERLDLVLCLHGEMPEEFCLDREREFLPFVSWVLNQYPKLRVVLEHITTADAVHFVSGKFADGKRLAATITLHHLMLTLDDVIGDKLRPHHFCKPIAKRPEDMKALRGVVRTRHPAFFLGSDSAPHPMANKECAESCAGVFSAPVLPELLVQLFEGFDALDALPGFVSDFGNSFYRLTAPAWTLRLAREKWRVPSLCNGVVPLAAGQELDWRLVAE